MDTKANKTIIISLAKKLDAIAILAVRKRVIQLAQDCLKDITRLQNSQLQEKTQHNES